MSKITDKQKLDYLFKRNQNLASTDLDINNLNQPLHENKKYVLAKEVLTESIPIKPDVNNIDKTTYETTYNVSINDFYLNQDTSLKKDANEIILQVNLLKLQKIPGTTNSWYYLDSTGNNFLSYVIPSNYGTNMGSNIPYYEINVYSKDGLDKNSRNESYLANEKIKTCDYIFDYNNGILLLSENLKDNNDNIIDECNPPYISFYKYTGKTLTDGGVTGGTTTTVTGGGQWTKNNDDESIYYKNGNVLIGLDRTNNTNTNVNYELEISGNVYISNNLHVKGDQIIHDDLHVIDDISANTLTIKEDADISGNLTVSGNSVFQDVSLNKIGTATRDVSNIIIDGNLIPYINEGYDLGSSTMKWRDLYLSNNSIIFKQDGDNREGDVVTIGINATDDDDGSTNYTLELNVKGKDDNDDEPNNKPKKVRLAKGKVKKTMNNGKANRKAEIILQDASFNNVDVFANLNVFGPKTVVKDISGNIACFTNLKLNGIEIDGSGGDVFINNKKIDVTGGGIELLGDKDSDPTYLVDDSDGLTGFEKGEGRIFYDLSKNIFVTGVRQYSDTAGKTIAENPLLTEPLGYSFYRMNMEGQPPSPDPNFFFFLIGVNFIQLIWENPKQYTSHLTASTSQELNETSPIINGPTADTGGLIYFPVVNRIMLQIKDIDNNQYIPWGTERSPISQNIDGLKGGYVIASKDYPIAPTKNSADYNTIGNLSKSDFGRDVNIYKLDDFPTSIVLYTTGNTPEDNSNSYYNDASYNKVIFPLKNDASMNEIPVLDTTSSGFEFKFWLENQFTKSNMDECDFNVLTFNGTTGYNTYIPPGDDGGDDDDDPDIPSKDDLPNPDPDPDDPDKPKKPPEKPEPPPPKPKPRPPKPPPPPPPPPIPPGGGGGGGGGGGITTLPAPPPSADASLNILLKFNNISDDINIDDADSFIELKVKDPTYVSDDLLFASVYNEIINLSAIKFEWAYYSDNTNSEDIVWEAIHYVYTKSNISSASSFSEITPKILINGVYNINRKRDDVFRYYYVSINTNKDKRNIRFRISYKNFTNPVYTLQNEEDFIKIDKPSKPIINSIKMFTSTQLQLVIEAVDSNDKINGAGSTSTNTDNAIFLKQIKLFASYEGSDNVVTELFNDTNQKLYQYLKDQNNNTQYIFDLSGGLSETILPQITGENLLKWSFKIQVKNNYRTAFSVESDTKTFTINKVSTSNQVTDFKFVQGERTNISNAEMDLRWENPAAGDRGVGKSNLNNENNQIPTIYDYQYSVFRPDVSEDNRIIIDASNIQNNRTTDSDNQGTNLPFIFDIFDKNGNKNNSSGSGNTGGNEREIKTIINQRNEYVTSQTQITGSLYYKLSPPGLVNITSNIYYVTPHTNDINYLKLLWNKPNETGLQIKELADKTVKDYVEIPLGIKQYDIDITAERTTSKSPYYYLQGNDTAATNDVSISGIEINFTRDQNNGFIDAIGSLSGNSNGIINKNTVKWSGSSGDTIANLLVFPDTKYIFNIKTTNVFSLQGQPKTIEINTDSPDSLLKQFNTTDKKIPIHSTYGDININNNGGLFYGKKGFLLESNVDTKPTTITLYEITKALKIPSFSANDTHRINKNKFNDFLVNDTDKIPNEYVKSTSQLVDKKLRQFRIKNNANYIYVFGSNSNFSFINNDTAGTALENMLAITSTEVSDEFAEGSGKDTNNRGYWWKENIKYTITIDSSKETLYKNPVKLSLETRYNNKLSTKAEWSTSSLGTGNDVDIVERVIFQNSNNPSGHIYFDKLTNLPSAIKKDVSINMINYTTDNKINGIPNLYMLSNDFYFDISLNYKLTNFSQYYGLNNAINFVEHSLKSNVGSNVCISEIQPRSWNSKSDCTRTANGWTISDLTITNESATNVTNVDVGSSNETGSDADVRLQLNLKNTFGDKDFDVNSNYSTIFRFIYDKNSVDEYNNISSTLFEIPSSFDPELGTNSTGTSSTVPSLYAAIGDQTNNLQMSMYDGYFYSNAGWQNITGITASNCSNYGLLNTLPVFDTNNNNYRYSIFKYSKTFTAAEPIDRVMCSLQGENSDSTYEIKISDLYGGGVEVYMYLIIDGTAYFIKDENQNSYYWLNISKSGGGITFTDSAFKNIIYSGGLADTGYQSDTDGMSNASFISGTGTNSITTSTKGFTSSGAFSESFPRRLIGAYINVTTIGAGKTADVYIAIKCRNDIQRRFKKPKLYLANGNTLSKTFEIL